MNPLQAINSAASFAIFSALIAGLIRMFDVDDTIPWSALAHKIDDFLLALFIVLFRIKMHFDDHRYFAGADRDIDHLKYVGVVLAILVWIAMAVSAGTVDRPRVAASFLLVSLLISTIWLLSHVAQLVPSKSGEAGTSLRQRLSWGAFNMIYCLALAAYIMAGSVGSGLFRGHSDLLHSAIVISMIIALIIEKVLGKTYKGFLG